MSKEPINCPKCGKLLGYVDIFVVGIDGAKPAAWLPDGTPVAWPVIAFRYLYTDGNEAYDFPPEILDKYDVLCQACADEVGTRVN